jgi:RNA recognition motif-containing protein
MDSINLRDPATSANRIYIGHINESVTQELLNIKFSPYGNIVGFLRTASGFCFIQYDNPLSATNAINNENGSSMGNLKITVKTAEMKSQKRKTDYSDMSFDEMPLDMPMNKKYFSEGNEYYGNNSIMAESSESDVNHCEIIVVSKNLV